DELEPLELGAEHAQRLDAAEVHPAAAMHGETGRLIEDEKTRVLVDDPVREPCDGRRRGRRGGPGAGPPDRGHSDPVPGSKLVAWIRAARVHADLAGPDKPVDMAAWHAFQAGEQKVVESLAR